MTLPIFKKKNNPEKHKRRKIINHRASGRNKNLWFHFGNEVQPGYASGQSGPEGLSCSLLMVPFTVS